MLCVVLICRAISAIHIRLLETDGEGEREGEHENGGWNTSLPVVLPICLAGIHINVARECVRVGLLAQTKRARLSIIPIKQNLMNWKTSYLFDVPPATEFGIQTCGQISLKPLSVLSVKLRVSVFQVLNQIQQHKEKTRPLNI